MPYDMAKHKSASKDPPARLEPAAAEGYTVLARRYRPQTLADLVGQEPVARALSNALTGNRVAHAYLFTGARGVGKTSTARILAKALNCAHGPTPTPCGECEICRSIASGEDVDVLEIDGASNNGVDDVRDLRGNVQYRPQRARFKIYIIDEVHMLSKGAFNALLKTLEEPPPHVKFIFATTEVEKVPITILSRCQRFDFAGIPLPRIVERLREIVAKEGMEADAEALEIVARRAGGSMRDAQSLLDQLLAFGGDKLTADQVHRLLGTAGDERILALADAAIQSDTKRVLDLLDEAVVSGLQLGELVDQLIAYWRDLMVVSCGGTEGRDLSVPPRHHDTLRGHAQAVSLDATLAGLDVLSLTKARLRTSTHGRTLVEMALVRLGRLSDLVSLTQLAQWVGQVRLDPRSALAPLAGGAQPALPRLTDTVKKKPLSDEPLADPPSPSEVTAETWPIIWPKLVGLVGAMLSSELAKAGTPAITGPNSLVFRFPVAYNQAREFFQKPDRVAKVEDALRRALGRAYTVRFEEDTTAAPAADGPANGAGSRPRTTAKEQAEKVPLVRRAVEVLGAAIQRVEDGFGGDGGRPVGNGEEA
ncbi:MAG: DNA polymerase III subunit gamma/tau [Gemmataceae bacterium]